LEWSTIKESKFETTKQQNNGMMKSSNVKTLETIKKSCLKGQMTKRQNTEK